MKAAVGTPIGVAFGERYGRLEGGDGVVRDGPDSTAGETRHPLGRLDAAARDEAPDRVKRVGCRDGVDRQVRTVGRDRDGPRLDPGEAIADLEQATGTDTQERVAAQALATLDRLEEVCRIARVEAQEGTDGGLEIGRAAWRATGRCRRWRRAVWPG
jgi:hypothetical protein